MSRIVIFGGYGAVGRQAAAELVEAGQEVILAGRDPDRAEPVPGASVMRADVSDDARVAAALEGADAVLMCAERNNVALARACFLRGIHYLDVTASYPLLSQLEQLDSNGATGVLSVGLVPGVTNLLATHVAQRSEGGEVRIGVLLGAGEAHGPAAMRWTLDNLGRLSGSWMMDFPEGRRRVHRFPFSDQYTLGLGSVMTGLGFDSRALTTLLAAARLPGLARLLRSRMVESALGKAHVGSDRFAVKVESGTAGAWFTGHGQSRATGLVAALLIQRLPTLPPGVRHIERLVDPAEFLTELTGHGFQLGLA